jgi:hypothetical protein
MLPPSLLLDLASFIFELLVALGALAFGLGQLVLKALQLVLLGLFRFLLRLNSLLQLVLLLGDSLLQAFGLLEESLLLAFDRLHLLLRRRQVDIPKLLELVKLVCEVLDLAVFYLLGEFLFKFVTAVFLLRQDADKFGDVAADFAVVLASLSERGNFRDGA